MPFSPCQWASLKGIRRGWRVVDGRASPEIRSGAPSKDNITLWRYKTMTIPMLTTVIFIVALAAALAAPALEAQDPT